MATPKNTLGLVVCAFFIVSLGLMVFVEKASGISTCHSKQISSQKADCTNTPSLIGDMDLINGHPIGQAREGMFVEAILNGNGTYVFFDGRS